MIKREKLQNCNLKGAIPDIPFPPLVMLVWEYCMYMYAVWLYVTWKWAPVGQSVSIRVNRWTLGQSTRHNRRASDWTSNQPAAETGAACPGLPWGWLFSRYYLACTSLWRSTLMIPLFLVTSFAILDADGLSVPDSLTQSTVCQISVQGAHRIK